MSLRIQAVLAAAIVLVVACSRVVVADFVVGDLAIVQAAASAN